jgi:HD-GYP domain-containing protein (c-di-GMP phosphodiesterase class II)
MTNVLFIGVGEEIKSTLPKATLACPSTVIPHGLEDLDGLSGISPSLIICGDLPDGVSAIQLALSLKGKFDKCPIFLIAEAFQGAYDRATLIKCGFTDVFLLPFDEGLMMEVVGEAFASASDSNKVYRTVSLGDIATDSTLPFDVYIHMRRNDKYIKFLTAGDPLDAYRAAKLKSHDVHNVNILKADTDKFYEHSAKRLRDLKSDSSMGETERRERTKAAVRGLIGGLFSSKDITIDEGKQIAEDAKNIVKSYMSSSPNGKWFERIVAMSSSTSELYTHSANVATYSVLFSMLTGQGNPEDIALAGLFHDIGLAKVRKSILDTPSTRWSPDDRKTYENHPQLSKAILRDRKIAVSDLVHRAIHQHHEKFNGRGYPKGAAGKTICVEARILAIADKFDELTASGVGSGPITPREALIELYNLNVTLAENKSWDPELLETIYNTLLSSASQSVAA